MRVLPREVRRCLLAGVRWLFGPQVPLKVTGKTGIRQARSRLGGEPLKQLHEAMAEPIAVKQRGKVLGTGIGNWSVWRAARWRSPAAQKTGQPVAGLAPAGAAVPILKSAWWL
jgi:hypothetical protein